MSVKTTTDDLPLVSEKKIKSCEYENEDLEKYSDYQSSLYALFSVFPTNDYIESVLIKSSVLNNLYSTNILAIHTMAKNIHSKKIDKELNKGESHVVNDIATGHGIGKASAKHTSNFYSFATKYCHFHKPELYPIYDYYVHKMLDAYSKISGKRVKTNFKDYDEFRQAFNDFKEENNLNNCTNQEIDKFLWVNGRKKFPRTIWKKKILQN